jgi:drug/metabolite transporter (DMT)-like permease
MSASDADARRRTALLFLGIGVLAFGSSGVLIKLCAFPAAIIASLRMALAGAVLAPFCATAWRRFLALRGGVGVLLLLLPGILLGLHFQTWVAGLKGTTVANGTFIFSINPLFFALAERFLRRRRVPPYALVSLGLVAAGAWWLLAPQHGQLGRRGDLLCLLSTLLFVVYLFVSRRVSAALEAPHLLYIHVLYLGGGLATLPLALIGGQLGRLDLADGASLAALAGLAFLPTLVGHTASNYGVRFLPPLTVSFFTLAEPVLASAAALVLLGEVPAPRELPSYGLFLAATVLYLARSRGRALEERPGPEGATSGRRRGSWARQRGGCRRRSAPPRPGSGD